MGKWVPVRTASVGGRFQLHIHKLTTGGVDTDVTSMAGVATQLTSYSASDPFGDATAVFTFPMITPFDDLDSPDLSCWLANYADVDLYWIPAVPRIDARYDGFADVQNPITGLTDLVAPGYLRDSAGHLTTVNRIKIWEGFIASMDFTANASSAQLEVQCQGALFQLDHYLQKPWFPARPWPIEALIADVFDHKAKPHLRTQPLITTWPAGWSKIAAPYTANSANVYSPVVKPGSKWTGLTSRETGAWEHALTGFVQNQLSLLITDAKSGVTPGNQWTITQRRKSPTCPGRQPVLEVRDRFRPPDIAVWLGAPGVEAQLSADSTQSENVVYGDGTDPNGQVWRNAVISSDGSRTDYLPLAASALVYPARHNPAYSRHAFTSEARVSFGAGFAQPDAVTICEQQLNRDQQPGWLGTITLSVDPSPDISRWAIQPGWTVLLKGFLGTGDTGIPFHIASIAASPMEGTIALTVDTRYRDLLTVAESLQRTRDPLTPVRMLQVGKTSQLIQDIQAPWDYHAGSGFIPRPAKDFYAYCPRSTLYPYTDWSQKHPPLHHPHWYVKVDASNADSLKRWTVVAILASEAGTINRSEFYCCDVYGRLLKIPYHVSIYSITVTGQAMPHLNGSYSAYQDNAFESNLPNSPQVVNANLGPANGLRIGWGNRADGIYNRAGFSPGSEALGNAPTGLLFDDATWEFNTTDNLNYQKQPVPGYKQSDSALSLWVAFYAEHTSPVYFQGRLFKQNQAGNS